MIYMIVRNRHRAGSKDIVPGIADVGLGVSAIRLGVNDIDSDEHKNGLTNSTALVIFFLLTLIIGIIQNHVHLKKKDNATLSSGCLR